MRQKGLGQENLNTRGLFSCVGLREADGKPEPALSSWDELRVGEIGTGESQDLIGQTTPSVILL